RMSELYAGVELGGTKCVAILAGGPDEILAREIVPTTTPDETLGKLGEILSRWRSTHEPLALGIASFGPLELDRRSADYGRIAATPKEGWKGAPVKERL